MSAHRYLNFLLTGLLVAMLSMSYLLDGPSEMDAMRATAAAKRDAIKSASISAHPTKASARKDTKTVVAGVQP